MEIFLCKTLPKSVTRVYGEDAEDYLQSQWTINLRKLKIGGIRYGLRLSTKGKVLADSYFLRLGDEEFLLISRDCLGANLIQLLEENIVADEVEFTNESGKWEIHTFWHNQTCKKWEIPNLEFPQGNTFVSHKSGYLFEDYRISPGSISILLPQGTKNEFNKNVQEVSSNELATWRVQNGLPSIPDDIGENELPQEGRLEIDAVDFNKGCYLGQEVMARIHAMGRVRRSTYPVSWSGSEMPALPAPLLYEGKKVGFLKSLFLKKDNQPIGIALIHENGIEAFKEKGLRVDEINNGMISSL